MTSSAVESAPVAGTPPHVGSVLTGSDVPAPPAHNVPAALSSFVGRTREIASVCAALAGARLLTLSGAGGAGKTRLAREVAAVAAAGVNDAPAYPDGVWWVELAPVPGGEAAASDGVAQAVANVLGVRLEAGRGHAAAVLAGAVGTRRLLLVLDNCEHVVGAAAELLDALLRACPRLAVLATSREALGVEGETAWVVPPLAHPPRGRAAGLGFGAEPVLASAIAGYDAVQLFVDRARAAAPAFALTDRNAPAVAAICARLDGVPLALELAAVHVGTLGAEALAERLDDVLGLLTRGRRTAPPRHQTLRALLDWSYGLLTPAEQRLLCQLSVFRDAASLDAVAAVCRAGPPGPVVDGALGSGLGSGLDGASDGDGGVATSAVVAALGRLVEQSLVGVRDDAGGVQYALLETVRQYGAERLAGTAEAGAVRDRHLAWAADTMRRAAARLWSPDWLDAAAHVTPVLDDLRAAVAWAEGAADGSPAGVARATHALQIGGRLEWYWLATGGFDDAAAVIGAALRAAERAGIAVRDPVRRWAPAPSAAPAARRAVASALIAWGSISNLRNRLDEAVPAGELVHLWDAECAAAERAVAGCAAPDDAADRRRLRRLRVHVRVIAAETCLVLGDLAGARALGDDVVAVARASGDLRAVAFALARRGFVLGALGDGAAAVAMMEESVPLWEAQGERGLLAMTRQVLAEFALAAGDGAAAARHARASLASLRGIPHAWLLARALDFAARALVASPTPDARAVGGAARMLGAADGVRTRAGIVLQDYFRPAYEQTAAAAAAVLGDAAFREAWVAGGRLDGLDALEEGLALATPPSVTAAPAATAVSGGDARPTSGSTPEAIAPTVLGLRVLGPLALTVDGVPVEPLPAGKLAELLVYLVLHPDGRTKEQIGLALWPDASAAQVRNSFHFTLHHLRRMLGDRGWVAHAQARYRLERALAARGGAPAAVLDCDADALTAAADALRRAARARTPIGEALLDDARRALAAPVGELGAGLTLGDWAVPHQDRLRTAWEDGMAVVAHALAAAGRWDEATAAYEAILAHDPLREAAHRGMIACLASAGEPARALAHYTGLVELLRREVGAAPSRETRELAERVRAA